jgi:cobalt-zinc-cadmium efflux system outer membrane protein
VERGLSPAIDLDIAESEKIQRHRMLSLAIRRWEQAKYDLTVMMGIPFDSELIVQDQIPVFQDTDLNPQSLLELGLTNRSEIKSGNYNVLSSKKKIDLSFLDRTPNMMIGGFVQRDGFQENVVGARLSVPLRVWRDQSGEIEEAKAFANQSEANLEISKHSVILEILKAYSSLKSIRREKENFPEDLLIRSDQSLENIKKAVNQGQLSLRDALISQTSLVSLKAVYLQIQLDHALSNIELIRAAGLPLMQYRLSDDP